MTGADAPATASAPPPLLVAEFRDPDTLLEAARRARAAGMRGLDAHTPFTVEGLTEALGLPRRTRLHMVMLLAGLAGAAFVYWLQWYSAVHAYPIDSGGRPLHSWPVFLVPTFEAGILSATLAGIAAFLIETRLPRLNHPVFEAPDFARASQDRFFLAVADPKVDAARLAALLDGLGPVEVREAGP